MTSPNERPDLPPVPASTPDPAGAPEPAPTPEPAPVPQPDPATAAAGPGPDLRTTLEDGARAFDQRAQALGREAEAAVARLGENPAVRETADLATRLWGLVVLAIGLWFFADITLKLDLPAMAWGDLWPLILIIVGGFVILRGVARRS